MKLLIAAILTAALPAAAMAQAPAKPAKAKAAAHKPAPKEAPEADVQLSESDLEVAKKVHVGEIACELGAKVSLQPAERAGFFRLKLKAHEFLMHPVDSRTGAVRLEDRARGAVWLQLGNKSMLMSQKLGQRLADECQSADQVAFAEEMKKRPPINLLEPAPTEVANPATAADPAPTAAAATTTSQPAADTAATPAAALALPQAQGAIATPVAPATVAAEPLPPAAAVTAPAAIVETIPASLPAQPSPVLETTPAALPAAPAPSQ